MGCWLNKALKPEQKYTVNEELKSYSWDNKDRLNVDDFIIENCYREQVVKEPGTINGQQLLIRNSKDSSIFIFDHINTVNVDEVTNCKIVFGAVKGSVFLRDCSDCSILVACGQFRVRDCRKMNVFLLCATQPIIESSSMIHFGCYQLFYKGLEDHFHKAELSVFNNNWSSLHDYTPSNYESNWCLLPDNVSVKDYFTLPSHDVAERSDLEVGTALSSEKSFSILSNIDSGGMCDVLPTASEEILDKNKQLRLEVSFSNEKSVVPYTLGSDKPSDKETCLVAFFSDGQHAERARCFINTVREEYPNCQLIVSRETHLLPDDAKCVFRTTAYDKVVQCGMVVGLHYIGADSIRSCQKVAVGIATAMGLTGLVYVSNDPRISPQQVSDFFKSASMAG